jgi:hypothetical protein
MYRTSYYNWRRGATCQRNVQTGRNGPVVFTVYEEIIYLLTSNEHCPNFHALAQTLSSSCTESNFYSQLINYAKCYVQPAYNYFTKKCDEDLASEILHARLFDPSKVRDIKPIVSDTDYLKLFLS